MEKSTERLYQAAKELKGLNNPSQIARILNTSPQTIKNWETRGVSKEGLLEAQKIIGISAKWLETGKGEMTFFDSKPQSNASFIGTLDVWDSQTPLQDDDIELPFYKEICLSAGNGFADDIEDHNGYKLRFSRSTLKRKGIHIENAVCVSTNGNSMEPVFRDGTALGIDMGDKNIRDGKIYAFNHDGLLRTKVLTKRPGNKVLIHSYNTDYIDEEVPMESISIIGRIFWWSVLD